MNHREKEEAKKGHEQLDAYLESAEQHNAHSGASRTDILLKEFEEASKRTRTSLMAICIISILLFIGVFNHQWSWLATKEFRQHELMWDEEFKSPVNPNAYINNEEALIAAINRLAENDKPGYPRHQIHELLEVEMKTIEVPILGIQIYIEDMPILGGLGVMLLLMWFYFVRRRERSIVKMLHSVATFAKPHEKKYQIKKIYTTLAFSQVFNFIPRVDNIEKPKWREKLASLKIKMPSSKLFSYHMPFIPCLVILVVISIDIYETFVMESDLKLIPNVQFLEKERERLFACESDSCLEAQTRYADTLYNEQHEIATNSFIQKVNAIRRDTSKDTGEKISEIKKAEKIYIDTVKVIRDSVYNEGTTIAFYKYRAYQFKEFLHHHARFSMPLTYEIWWVRTITPLLILIINFILAWYSRSIAISRDFHMEGLTIHYEKYYPQNFNIYTIPYAYVSLLIINKRGKGIKDVTVHAVNNVRKIKTTKDGLARFIELQVIEEGEIFEFYHNGEVFMDSFRLPALVPIVRYGSAWESPERPEVRHQHLIKLRGHTADPLKTSIEKKLLERLKSVTPRLSGYWSKPSKNGPVSNSGKPISRLAATQQLVKGEMMYCFKQERF